MNKKLIRKRRMRRRIFKITLFAVIVITSLSIRNTLADKDDEKVIHANIIVKSEKKVADQQREASTLENKKENILLANKNNRLHKNYLPEDLTITNIRFIWNGDPNVRRMSRVAAKALERLFEAAEEKKLTLLGVSGYRSYSYQKELYNNKVNRSGKEEADKYVAQAGASEHQTGLAMDILSTEYTTLDEGFENTKAYEWIVENCHKYGFIIRYPKGKEEITGYNFEPWHLRYVGVDVATEIMSKGITLEEYLGEDIINI